MKNQGVSQEREYRYPRKDIIPGGRVDENP